MFDWMRGRGRVVRRVTSGSAALLVVVLLVGVACGESVDSGTGPLALYDGGPSGDDADADGVLTREGDCIYIDWENRSDADDKRDSRILVVFADSVTSWDEGQQAVRFGGRVFRIGSFAYHFGGQVLRVGEQVEFGGGGHSGSPVRLRLKWIAPPDPSCDATTVWVAG